MIFETHAHYEDECFDEDREALLGSLRARGIGPVVNVGSSLATTKATIALTEKYDFIYGAAGIHPSETEELNDENFREIEMALKEPKIVALGEIGLDYHYMPPEKDMQLRWFERQLELGRRMDVPIIIHSREAAQDTVDLMKAAGGSDLSAVIHCFSYPVEMAKIFLNMGYYIGVGGVVTFKNSKKLKEVVQYMPLDRLLLETDCPYMAPTPLRGRRNESGNLHYVVKTIAELRGISEQELEDITYENACRFYRISPKL